MNSTTSLFIVCSSLIISVTVFEQKVFSADVETNGNLTVQGTVESTTGGIKFPDNSVQTSACSGCANGILSISLGGTGADNASGVRSNLGVPGLDAQNTFTFGPQTLRSGAASLNALIVQGAVGQSANLQEWRTSGGTALVSVGSGGEINLPAPAVIRTGEALLIHNSSNGNFSAGKNAGNQSMTGCCNTASGELAFDANTSGHNNTASGYLALSSNTTGNYNSAMGRAALVLNSEGSANSAIGYYSISYNVNGGYNTAVGYQSLSNTTSSYGTAVGANALFSNTEGGFNTAIGSNSLNANTTGSYNTASGYQALRGNTTAGYNTAIGAKALYTQSYNNSDAPWESHNTAVGFEALYSNQPGTTDSGAFNTAIGSGVLRSNTTGYRNTAIGYQAMYANSSGRRNTASGYAALLGNTSGYYNSAFGYAALYANSTGSNNTAIGHWAGDSYQNGTNNTFLGAAADATAEGFTNATAIGFNANVDSSNKVVIGNTSVSSIGGYTTWSNFSDRRVKTDIKEIGYGLDLIRQLRPVQYRMKNGNGNTDFGFIAQDIEALLGTEYNLLDIGGGAERMLSLRYTELIAPMVKAMQEQQEMIERLQAEVAELRRMLGK